MKQRDSIYFTVLFFFKDFFAENDELTWVLFWAPKYDVNQDLRADIHIRFLMIWR